MIILLSLIGGAETDQFDELDAESHSSSLNPLQAAYTRSGEISASDIVTKRERDQATFPTITTTFIPTLHDKIINENNNNDEHVLYGEFRDQTRFWVQRVGVPLIMLIGLFGNLITVIIMTRRRMRSTTNLYLAALALVDMLYLVLTFLLGFSHYPNMAEARYRLYWQLKPWFMMFTDACSNTSVWLTVTFTIERFIAVRFPMKGKVWCTEARAKTLIACVFIISLLFVLPVPFEWKVVEEQQTTNSNNNTTQNTVDRAQVTGSELGLEPKRGVRLELDYTEFGKNETFKTIYYRLSAILFSFIPLFSLILFNGFLIKSVHDSRRERQRMIGGGLECRPTVSSGSLRTASTAAATSRPNNRSSGLPSTPSTGSTSSAAAAVPPIATPDPTPGTGSAHMTRPQWEFATNKQQEKANIEKNSLSRARSSLSYELMSSSKLMNHHELISKNCDSSSTKTPIIHCKLVEQPQSDLYVYERPPSNSNNDQGIMIETTTNNHDKQQQATSSNKLRVSINNTQTRVNKHNDDNGTPNIERLAKKARRASISQITTNILKNQLNNLIIANHPNANATTNSVNANNNPQQQHASSQERRITIMLIAVVILFLVCQTPSAVLLLYTSISDAQLSKSEQNLLRAFGNIFNFLMAINAAGNFILYSFLSKKYRKTFLLLFCSCLAAASTNPTSISNNKINTKNNNFNCNNNKQNQQLNLVTNNNNSNHLCPNTRLSQPVAITNHINMTSDQHSKQQPHPNFAQNLKPKSGLIIQQKDANNVGNNL